MRSKRNIAAKDHGWIELLATKMNLNLWCGQKELLQTMTEFLVDHKCSFACVQGFQGQGLNCWLVGDQIDFLFEARIVGDLMMMELLAIKMNFCRQGSTDRSAGDRNEWTLADEDRLLATTRHFCRRQKFGPKIPRCLFAPKDRIVDDQNQRLTFAAEWCIAFAKARMVADPNDFLMPPRCESGSKLLANKLNYYRQGSRIITG